MVIDKDGNVGINTTTPASKLSINGGLHVGGDSDAGDNNLLVDGTVGCGVITQSGTTLANTYQPTDAGLDSLAGLTYAAASFVKMTGPNAFALRTIGETADDLEGTIEHDNLASVHQDVTTSGSPTFAGVVIANNGTIGQAAGPLLTFDDNNNFLEITNCKIGIGIAVPLVRLHVHGSTATTPFKLESTSGFYTSFDLQNSHADADGTTLRWRPMMVTRKTGGYGGLAAGSFAIRESKDASDHYRFVIDGAGNTGIGTPVPVTLLTVEGTLTLKEQAAADGSTAAYGQLWIKSDEPNILMFTDDAGTDFTVNVTPV